MIINLLPRIVKICLNRHFLKFMLIYIDKYIYDMYMFVCIIYNFMLKIVKLYLKSNSTYSMAYVFRE